MSGATPKPSRGRKNTPDPEKSLWHRLERSWPFTRIKKPVTLELDDNILLAGLPVPGPQDWHDNIVNLELVKQGTFRGAPATLFSVHVANWIEWDIQQSSVELRLRPVTKRSSKAPRSYIGEVKIAAYGPVYLTRPMTSTDQSLTREQLERVEVYPTKRGIMINSNENAWKPTGVHPAFDILVVVIHSAPVMLSTYITSSDKRRLRALRRSWVRPLIIDGTGERGPYPSTCGWSTHCGLGERCKEFGPEHMTATVWKELGRQGVPWMDGDGPEAWVKWPNPLLHGPLLSRSG